MATMAASIPQWAHRNGKAWKTSTSFAQCPSGSNVLCKISSPTLDGSTTSSGNKYTVRLDIKMPGTSSVSSISKVSVSFRPYDCNYTSGTLYGSLRSSSSSSTSDTVSTYRQNAIGSEAALSSIGYGTTVTSNSMPVKTMSFSGTFTPGATYYLFLYTKSTADIYEVALGASNFSAEVTYSEPSYTVTYNANGGTGAPSSQTKYYNESITLRTTKPTKSNTSTTGYTVTLNANGGTCATTSLAAKKVTTYTFSKWNTSSSGTGTSYAPGATYTANASVTLYAIYTSKTAIAAVNLPTPTREGCQFMGWAANSTATSGVIGSYTPSANTTLHAIWASAAAIYIETDYNIPYTATALSSVNVRTEPNTGSSSVTIAKMQTGDVVEILEFTIGVSNSLWAKIVLKDVEGYNSGWTCIKGSSATYYTVNPVQCTINSDISLSSSAEPVSGTFGSIKYASKSGWGSYRYGSNDTINVADSNDFISCCLSMTTPKFSGTSSNIMITLLNFYDENSGVKVRWALCKSDANDTKYLNTRAAVSDSYQIASGVISVPTTNRNYLLNITTSEIEPNTTYYLFLWPGNGTMGYYLQPSSPCYSNSFTITPKILSTSLKTGDQVNVTGVLVKDSQIVAELAEYNDCVQVVYLDTPSELDFCRYECYIDNGTGWDQYICYRDTGTDWE